MFSNIIKIREFGPLSPLPPFLMINTVFRIGYTVYQDRPAKKEIIEPVQPLVAMVLQFLGYLRPIKKYKIHIHIQKSRRDNASGSRLRRERCP